MRATSSLLLFAFGCLAWPAALGAADSPSQTAAPESPGMAAANLDAIGDDPAGGATGTPYPPSPVITGIEWAPPQTILHRPKEATIGP